jgi:hypothetical protein
LKKITVASGPAAAAPLAPLADAGTASAAPVPEKATGSVTCDVNHGQVTGTVKFDANKKTGGSLEYQASSGMWLQGIVIPARTKKSTPRRPTSPARSPAADPSTRDAVSAAAE